MDRANLGAKAETQGFRKVDIFTEIYHAVADWKTAKSRNGSPARRRSWPAPGSWAPSPADAA